jgi:hypothetical protein
MAITQVRNNMIKHQKAEQIWSRRRNNLLVIFELLRGNSSHSKLISPFYSTNLEERLTTRSAALKIVDSVFFQGNSSLGSTS